MNLIPEHINFDEICRSCMTKKDRMRPLFGSSLDSMLMTVANVSVSLNDGYPAQMCVQCVLQVSRAFTFKKQCEKTDTTLKEYLSRILQEPAGTVDFIPADDDNREERVQLISVTSRDQSMAYRFDGYHRQDECVLILDTDDRDLKDLYQGEQKEMVELPMTSVVPGVDENEQLDTVEECKQIELIDTLDHSQNILEYGSMAIDDDIVEDDHYDEAYEHMKETQEISFEINGKSNLFLINTFRCQDCQKHFRTNVELKEHQITCLKSLSSFTPDPKHLSDKSEKIKTVDKPPSYDSTVLLKFECTICNKWFSNTSKLRRHSRTHLVDKPHVCNVCGMSFAESSNLTKHHRKHTGELRNVVGKPNLCSVCGKRFKWATSLSKHMKHHTKRKLFTCPYPNCDKYYVEQRSLDIHIYSHDGKKPFSCSYCSKGFTQKCNLEKHERVHTGEKPFKCNVCHKSFAQSGYLVIHQRIHSQEKPYNCDECGKQFAASNALTVHLRSHSGERPYACDMCSKRFSRQETLTIHKARKHLNDASHPCTMCSDKYSTTEQLTEHLKSQHRDRCYHMCPTCGKVFASMQSLKNHQKVHLKEGIISEDQPQPMIQFVVDQEIITQTVDLTALEQPPTNNSAMTIS